MMVRESRTLHVMTEMLHSNDNVSPCVSEKV